MKEVLISIRPNHVRNILSGKKTVELRRRPVRVPAGSHLWIYSTLPEGRIAARATVAEIIELPPQEMWNTYKSKMEIDYSEFSRYIGEIQVCFGIKLSNIKELSAQIELETLRCKLGYFQPPQFLQFLSCDSDLASILREAV